MAHSVRWACLCLMLATLSSVAADWRTALPLAQRLGEGDFTWFGLRLYTARLWTADSRLDWNQPFALELLYHRSMSRETLVQASVEEMRRLGSDGVTSASLAAWTQAMEAAFVDVRPGMRITGLYLPGKGCRFYVDGQPTREIFDPLFARAFFAIWLDPRARDLQLRQRLLGLGENDRGT
ncbi:chalcone isomerase family protein [Pseudomonas citrulli]|uniref:Chalcone isomerase family protein n=1 Tax=Pseudomonas citrulli TaxID=3064347 RepID=A0ABT9BU06_9PSED|nr:chalcone isomerase family protein [Pseudomonas sp. K18]MDO7896046.1 chalcone isomerase family protein [Pseudomonas sp. K18]